MRGRQQPLHTYVLHDANACVQAAPGAKTHEGAALASQAEELLHDFTDQLVGW